MDGEDPDVFEGFPKALDLLSPRFPSKNNAGRGTLRCHLVGK